MRPIANLFSDLVSDSKIETVIESDYVEHTFNTHNISRDGPITTSAITERWVRDNPNAFLGEGTFGTVYRERCGRRLRAVKELRKSVIPGEEIEVARELEAIAKFSHPKYSRCFVTSHGWFEIEESVFIAMEYLPHGDLLRHLKAPLPESETRVIVAQVLEGLDYMHQNRFIHRDLKLANIMVVRPSPDWHVKISDFGISKRRQEGVSTYHTMNRGTQGYAAPEVFGLLESPDGVESSEAVAAFDEYALDIWSLGVVAFRLLTQALPFPMPADLMFYTIGRKKFPENALVQIKTSQDGIDFIRSLMTPHPSTRKTTKEARSDVWVSNVCSNNRLAEANRITSEPNDEQTLCTPVFDGENFNGKQSREQGISHTPQALTYVQPTVEDASDSDDSLRRRIPRRRPQSVQQSVTEPRVTPKASEDRVSDDYYRLSSSAPSASHRKGERNRPARSPSGKSDMSSSPDSDHWSVRAEQSSGELPRYSLPTSGKGRAAVPRDTSQPRHTVSYAHYWAPHVPSTTPLTAYNLGRVPGHSDYSSDQIKHRGENSSMRAADSDRKGSRRPVDDA